MSRSTSTLIFFFFNDTATTEIYTLSLHDALPIYLSAANSDIARIPRRARAIDDAAVGDDHIERLRRFPGFEVSDAEERSEEHTSELQSRSDLVCRLLLEKKKE